MRFFPDQHHNKSRHHRAGKKVSSFRTHRLIQAKAFFLLIMTSSPRPYDTTPMKTDVWLTPPFILESLGEFDLDPCAAMNQPWKTAKHQFTKEDNGLDKLWSGRVWMNPPYGREAARWLEKLAIHNRGIALIFARTETRMFFSYVWPKASAVLFLKGRLHFHFPDGKMAPQSSGAPSVLCAYGDEDADCLNTCGLSGQFIRFGNK